MEVVAVWNGHLTNALRVALRMTVEEFAERLGMSARAMAKWEANRDIEPAMASQQLLDIALNQAPADVRARFADLTAQRDVAAPLQVHAPAVLDIATPQTLLGSAHPLSVTRPALAWYDSSLRELYSADNSLGPVLLLPAVATHVQNIERMIPNSDAGLLDELLRIGAGYAEFAGWLSQDAGDLAAARRWSDRAYEWAECADDRRMVSFVLMRRAVQAIGAGDGRMGVRLASAAQRDRGAETTRVRAIAAQTEAVAQALLGEAAQAERQLDVAGQLTEAQAVLPLNGDPTGGGRYCELGLYLRISRAKCHLTLGQADQAVEAFGAVIDALPDSYHRDRGQYLARLATASAMADLPEQACAQATESLTIAISTGSSRTISEVRRFARRASKRWPTHPEVRGLSDMLGAFATDGRA